MTRSERLQWVLRAMDVGYKAAVWFGLGSLLGLSAAERVAWLRVFVPIVAVVTLLWELYVAWAVRPLRRWSRGAGDAVLVAAYAATQTLPRRLTWAWTLHWALSFTPSTLLLFVLPEITLPRAAVGAALLACLGLCVAPPAIGVSSMAWALRATGTHLAREAWRRGLSLPERRLSLRRRTVLICTSLAMAPTLLVASVGYMASVEGDAARSVERARAAAAELAAGIAVPSGGAAPLCFRLDGAGTPAALVAGGAAPPAALLAAARARHAQTGAPAVASDERSGAALALAASERGVFGAVVAPQRAVPLRFLATLGAFVAILVTFAPLAALFFSELVIAALRRVGDLLGQIARAGAVTRLERVPVAQRDEIGELAHNANTMIDRLEEAEEASRAAAAELAASNADLEHRVDERTRQLGEAARRAGMAEVAASVLHNVGNVLNSVNVSTGVIAGKLRGRRISALLKALALVPENEDEAAAFLARDRRGKLLPLYLRKAAAALAEEQDAVVRELEFLEKNVEHIKTIVSLQQAHARPGGLVEVLRLSELVDDALRFSLPRTCGIEIRRELEELPPVVGDRHRLFQIIVNLLHNARDAVGAVAAPLVTVRLRREGPRVLIEVGDNGVGVAPENLTRIFALGFTTKPTGNGYGLHSSALAARELGGELTLQSEGEGRGTTFTLAVPLEAADAHRRRV